MALVTRKTGNIDCSEKNFLSSFGRRIGKRLGVGQKAALKDLLPRLSIEVIEGETFSLPRLFPFHPREIWMEIGFGGGEFLAGQAAKHPDVGLIGCEPYLNGVASAVQLLTGQGSQNVRIWANDARDLIAHCAEGSIHKVFILFPDPSPKTRHHKRRIISTRMLDLLQEKLVPGGQLILATDHKEYAAWMLQHITGHEGFIWQEGAPADMKEPPESWVPTRYEAKTRAMGSEPVFFKLRRR